MTYQTIFFDLDGTLINPKDGITKSAQYALSKFGIDAKLEDLVPFIGPPLHKCFELYYGFSEEKAMQAVMYYREYFIQHGIQEAMLYDGVVSLLEKLKQKNKTLNVVTSKLILYAPKILEEKNIYHYFDNIIATKPDMSNADKPTLVKEALTLYPEIVKEAVVMIGDREHDIIGAKANGIDSIGVLYGYGTEDEMKKNNPTYIVESIEELGKILLAD